MKFLLKSFRNNYHIKNTYDVYIPYPTALYRVVNDYFDEIREDLVKVINEFYESDFNGCVTVAISRQRESNNQHVAVIESDLIHLHKYNDIFFITSYPFGVNFALGNRYVVNEIDSTRPEYIFQTSIGSECVHMGDMLMNDGTLQVVYAINSLCSPDAVAMFLIDNKQYLSTVITNEIMAYASDEYRKYNQEKYFLELEIAIQKGEITHDVLSSNPMEDFYYKFEQQKEEEFRYN